MIQSRNSKTQETMSTKELIVLGAIQASVGSLELDIKGALVSIRHEDRADIAIKANYPKNWTFLSGSVHQVKVQEQLGSGGIVDSKAVVIAGNNYGFINTGEVYVNGKQEQLGGRGIVDSKAVVIAGNNYGFINVGEVYVNGKKVTAGEPTNPSGPPRGPDKLEIIVPNAYKGSLRLTYMNGSEIDMDNWEGDDVSFSSVAGGDLKAGRLTSLSAFVLQSSGSGNFTIEMIETETFTATKTGNGDLDIEELNTSSLLLTQTGSGDTTISHGAATSGSVNSIGSGDISMRGRFGNLSKCSLGSGEVKISISD